MTRFAKALPFVVFVLLLSACSGGEGSGGGDGDVGAAATGAAGGEELASEGGGGGAAGRPIASADFPGVGPRIVKNATLRVTVAEGSFEAAVDDARAIAAGLGGFVVGSSASQAGRGRLVRGSLVLRVPARAYEQALRELGRVGRVEGMSDEARDASQEFVDLEARRRHLEAVERQLLSLLDRAETVAAALAVQSQLNETQLELERVRGRLSFLEDQTAYATISLTVRERGLVAPPADDRWGIIDAWRDGARAFVTVAGKVFVVVAAAAPLVLLLAFAWLGSRLLRRRIALPWRASRS